jgi:hypothetical protein
MYHAIWWEGKMFKKMLNENFVKNLNLFIITRTLLARCRGITNIVESLFRPAPAKHEPSPYLRLSNQLPALLDAPVARLGCRQFNVSGVFLPTSLSHARARPPRAAFVARQCTTLSLVSYT